MSANDSRPPAIPMLSRSASFILSLLLLSAAPVQAAAKTAKTAAPVQPVTPAPPASDTVTLAHPGQSAQTPPLVPFFDPLTPDQGRQGARLAIRDNNTTGRFTRQNFVLDETVVAADGDVDAVFRALLARGYRHILVNLPVARVRQLAALAEADNSLIYDIANTDEPGQARDCQANVLKLMPGRAMQADALAQYLLKKRWSRWFLAIGPGEADQRFAAAIRRAAQRFGAKIVEEKVWQHTFADRRTPESEIPVYTQGNDYDVLVVADEAGLFGDSLAYRTWRPRPVVGTQGLRPVNWHHTHEAWGALQLQNRFREQAGYPMTAIDYAAWLAVRAVGEAATRTRSVQFEAIRAYLRGTELALAGFKGVPLSFRPWDGRLRQPLLLAADRSMVAVAPLEGFLHPRNELDTLGYDEPESPCHPTSP